MLYKLENGQLITPPVVWKGVVGYNNDLNRLSKDGWKPVVTTGSGSVVEYYDRDGYIEEHRSEPPYDYREERRKLYPEIGDVIDALLKAYDGDDEELKIIQTKRQIIKSNIKKPNDAD